MKKSLPVLKSELGLPKGFGEESKYTNGCSYDLKGNWGKLPFRAPTLVGGALRHTSDFGLMMSRNIFTPTGYIIGIGNYPKIQNKKK